ncbi:hypothetical protein CAEBREN_08586 [Caenorhabditis brenneri]|uniref:Uncharacterized protein n=1 Tax=Caenorhabditis brenneri TaxID=135651 RepID=G0NF58_CAEBE|nr:hypothetical protein CAEBREN_08586 [Caenorhabditis brenneri]
MNTNPATMSMCTLDENVTLLLNHINSLELGELILFASNTDKHFIEFDERQMTRGFAHTKPKVARNSPIGECVGEYFHKFTNLLIPGITVPGAKQFMDDYRIHNKSIKQITTKMALRKRKACLYNSQLSREELRKTDQVHEKMALRQFLINKINISESREKAWEKWLEMRELLEDGIQLLRGLETWKVLVAEKLSSFPLRVFKTQTILPDTTTQGREQMKTIILKVIEKFELNWNAFKNTSTSPVPSLPVPLTLPLQNSSPNQASTSHFPQRFAANQVLPQSQPQAFPTPNPSLSNFYSQQPVLWNNPMQHVQHQAAPIVPPFSAHPSHPNHAPFGNNPHMTPNMTRCTPYPPPLLFFNRNLNVQNMQAPNAPTHWNTPFKFPPMNDFAQLPVLRPIQNREPNSSKPDEKAEPTDDEEVVVENVENERNSPFINVVD